MRISDWSSDVCLPISGDRLAETRPPGGDQRFVLGEARDQFGRGLSEGAAGVVLEMPVVRDDIAQERIERPIVTDQALVEEPWVPIIQNLADVEYNRRRARHVSPGGP